MARTCEKEGCNNPVFSKKLCQNHWRPVFGKPIKVYQSPLNANNSKKLRKRVPINRVSEKRAAQEKEYKALNKQYLLDNPKCQVRYSGCLGASSEIHHSQGRIGDLLTDVSKFVAICPSCHHLVTVESAKAIEDGHSMRRNTPVERKFYHYLNTNH